MSLEVEQPQNRNTDIDGAVGNGVAAENNLPTTVNEFFTDTDSDQNLLTRVIEIEGLLILYK